MTKISRLGLAILVFSLSGCQYFGVHFSQGNLITAQQVAKLHKGMSKQAVIEKLGSPVYNNTFSRNRWIYVETKQHRRLLTKQHLLLVFNKGKLLRIQRCRASSARRCFGSNSSGR